MCGIVGYIGSRDAVPLLMSGLSRLEYRGYDSAGLALSRDGEVTTRRSVGRLKNLEQKLMESPLVSTAGIGHTRWATHGEPSERNCHPHFDTREHIAVVHNYQELRDQLSAAGHTFRSDTDTEVIPQLIEEKLKRGAADFLTAFREALQEARGAYALGVVHQDEPDTVYAARLGSPLIIGMGQDEYFIASDVPAILNQVDQVIYLEDGELAVLRRDGVEIFKLDGSRVEPTIQTIDLKDEAADKAGFETFMLKEMHEQPRVLRNLLRKHTTTLNDLNIQGLDLDVQTLKDLKRIIIVSCGTAYYAGMYGRLILEHFTSIPVETDVASEFRYRSPNVEPGTLVIAVSQSGETADTLASIKLAREMGCRIFAICNVPGSSVVRESDAVFYTEAGLEIGVASTKAYTAQLMAFALFALHMGRVHERLSVDKCRELIGQLKNVPDSIHYVIERKDQIQVVADKHHDGPSALYLGRRFNYPTALEGALKNKEISYQHAEAYAAGEMKHGPIALINEYLPVICVCTHTEDDVYEKMISNMKEVEARNGRIIAIATDGDSQVKTFAEDIIYVPETLEIWSPMINVVAMQLLAYYAAQARGTDIDKPRNLAKSVTVE
jgi:glutamine---fructose-6-phosphate transaminase (isomerizing)